MPLTKAKEIIYLALYPTREKSLDGNNLLGYNNLMENMLHERDFS
jgi:hypothetical protein